MRRRPWRQQHRRPPTARAAAPADVTSLRALALVLAALLVLILAATTLGQQPTSKITDVTIQVHVYEPVQLQPTDENIAKVKVPSGFTLTKLRRG